MEVYQPLLGAGGHERVPRESSRRHEHGLFRGRSPRNQQDCDGDTGTRDRDKRYCDRQYCDRQRAWQIEAATAESISFRLVAAASRGNEFARASSTDRHGESPALRKYRKSQADRLRGEEKESDAAPVRGCPSRQALVVISQVCGCVRRGKVFFFSYFGSSQHRAVATMSAVTCCARSSAGRLSAAASCRWFFFFQS